MCPEHVFYYLGLDVNDKYIDRPLTYDINVFSEYIICIPVQNQVPLNSIWYLGAADSIGIYKMCSKMIID